MTATRLPTATIADDDCRLTFEAVPVAIWREDFSRVAEFSDALRAEGVTDIRAALNADSALLAEAIGRVVVRDVNEEAVRIAGATSRDDLIGPIPAQMLTEDAYAALIEQVAAVWEGTDRLVLALDGADYAGANASYELHWVAPTQLDGSSDYANVVVAILDVTERRRAEAQSEIHRSQLTSLIDVGRRIASSLDADVILQTIADAAVGVVDADHVLLCLGNGPGAADVRLVGSGFTSPDELESVREMVMRMDAVTTDQCEPIRLDNLTTRVHEPAEAGTPPNRHLDRAVLVVPVVSDDHGDGFLAAFGSPARRTFSEHDVSVLAILAEQAAVAIRNARLFGEVREARDSLESIIEELRATQTKLLQAQKLEAIGALAAGVAHEINTPIQYVADNTHFLKQVLEVQAEVVSAAEAVVEAIRGRGDVDRVLASFDRVRDENDFSFLADEAPVAVAQSLEGIERVGEIVRAMKEFAHPGSDEKVAIDINRAIRTTVEVSRNEWKYVADIEFDLDESLPLIPALAGPLNQSFLVIVVNAAQAIAETNGNGSGGKGRIAITTRAVDDAVEITFADTGPGVPGEILSRIFDPFFTTKEVGSGSGQGLSIAWSVVVEQHGGELLYDDSGVGATFMIRLPVAGQGVAR